ncbi:DUF4956 domain-containing protein [Myxococcota bacterium]|nr:DUF4956 domain-containing protein [Myxococcota bacterium]
MNTIDWQALLVELPLAALLGALMPTRLRRPDAVDVQVIRAAALLALSGALMLRIVDGEMSRAFGLLGAASVVRYRYGLGTSAEASWLILSLGVGMAVGSGLAPLAIGGTIFVILINVLFDRASGPQGIALRRTLQVEVRVREPGLVQRAEEHLTAQGLTPKLQELEQKESKDVTRSGQLHKAVFSVSAPPELMPAALVAGLNEAMGGGEISVREPIST